MIFKLRELTLFLKLALHSWHHALLGYYYSGLGYRYGAGWHGCLWWFRAVTLSGMVTVSVVLLTVADVYSSDATKECLDPLSCWAHLLRSTSSFSSVHHPTIYQKISIQGYSCIILEHNPQDLDWERSLFKCSLFSFLKLYYFSNSTHSQLKLPVSWNSCFWK